VQRVWMGSAHEAVPDRGNPEWRRVEGPVCHRITPGKVASLGAQSTGTGVD